MIWKEYLKENVSIDEAKNSTQKAYETLKAIMKATVKSDNEKAEEIWDMANDLLQWYDDNGSFTPAQAQWIWKTAEAFFNK